jgi:hypothetical protein
MLPLLPLFIQQLVLYLPLLFFLFKVGFVYLIIFFFFIKGIADNLVSNSLTIDKNGTKYYGSRIPFGYAGFFFFFFDF